MRIVAIAGSLRRASLNSGLLRAAAESAPEGVVVALLDLAEVPMYDGDVEAVGFPAPVRRLHDAIRSADAVLIASPEYNGSIPGVLKNALDWASRPRSDCPLAGKLVALLGTSPGRAGVGGALGDLHRVLERIGARPLASPPLVVAGRGGRFGPDGALTDSDARAAVAALVSTLASLAPTRAATTSGVRVGAAA